MQYEIENVVLLKDGTLGIINGIGTDADSNTFYLIKPINSETTVCCFAGNFSETAASKVLFNKNGKKRWAIKRTYEAA